MAELLLTGGFEHFSLSQQQTLKLTPNDGCVIVSLSQQFSSHSPALIAACTLSSCVNLVDPSTLAVTSVLHLQSDGKGVDGKHIVRDARFVPSAAEPNSLCAISQSSGVFKWDTRTPGHPVQSFDCRDIRSLKLNFLSMDVSCDGRLIASGSSATKKGDAFVGFWDARYVANGDFLGVYSDSHSQDVNAVAFHPSQAGVLLSGGADGLLCRFNLNACREDDALELSLNPENSLARVGWSHSGERLFGLSDMETFHAWDGDGEGELTMSSLPGDWRYIVDCLPDGESLLVGSHQGDLAVLKAGEDAVSCRLSGGHSDTVRSALCSPQGELLTGGEDGIVCAWRPGPGEAKVPERKKRLAESPELEGGGKKRKKKNQKSFIASLTANF